MSGWPRTRIGLLLLSLAVAPSAHAGLQRLPDPDSQGTDTGPTIRLSSEHKSPRPALSTARGLGISSAGDSTLVFSTSFDTSGSCSAQGWVGENRAGLIFAHVSGRFVQNGARLTDGSLVLMGTRALWVGADSVSAPNEVRNWVHPYGYGNGWSQRLISPAFSLGIAPDAVLRFEGYLDIAASPGFTAVSSTSPEFLEVQALKGDGTWTKLTAHFWSTSVSDLIARPVTGKSSFRCEVRLDQDGNGSLGLASTTQVRIVVQTGATGSDEDGGTVQGIGAAWLDNVTLKSAGSGLDVLSPLDFENGTLGAWSVAAFNTGLSVNPTNGYVRDLVSGIPLPAAEPGVASGIDPDDPSCLMEFTDASGQFALGTYARMSSPWFPIKGNAGFVLKLDDKACDLGRFFRVWALEKRAGSPRPEVVGQRGLFYDPSPTPVFETFFLRFPGDFFATSLGNTPGDSAQIWIETYDHRDRFGTYNTGPPVAGPLFDNLEAYAYETASGTADQEVLTQGPFSASRGQDISFDVIVLNNGPDDAVWSVPHYHMPAGTEFVSAAFGGLFTGSEVVWPPVLIANGGGISRTVTIRIVGDQNPLSVSSATSVTADPNPSNNDGSAAESRVYTLLLPGGGGSGDWRVGPGPVGAPVDTFVVASHSFEGPSGACDPQGWVGQNRSDLIFAHVSNRFLQNGVSLSDGSVINMGTEALWVGADSVSAPDEVRGWIQPYGYGNGWSQRLISPAFSLTGTPDAVLRFDGYVDVSPFAGFFGVGSLSQQFLEVQGLRGDGTWITLKGHFWTAGDADVLAGPIGGKAPFRCEVRLAQDGNDLLGLAASTQLRVVVQTDGTMSDEDGGSGGTPGIGAAWIDNLTLKSAGSGLDVIAPQDFESGSLGAWTLAALNTGLTTGPSVGYVRDLVPGIPAPASDPGIASGLDFHDPTCVMKFTDATGHLPLGAYGRMTSPWFPVLGDSGALLQFNAKVGERGRFFRVYARGKRYGETRATYEAQTGFAYGDSGADDAVAIEPVELRFPRDFAVSTWSYTIPLDSVQFVVEVYDHRDRFGTYNTGAPEHRPFIDDVRVSFLSGDQDGDGVLDLVDACPTSSSAGQDNHDGTYDGCPENYANLRHIESWAMASRPIRYRLSVDGDPRIADGSDLTEVAAGFQAWVGVPGSNVQLLQEATSTQKDASSMDGVNLVTFEDSQVSLPPNVLAVTPTFSLTRRGMYGNQIHYPGEIVDADMIFNLNARFSTPTHDAGPGSFDLRSVATHEAGHFLGISHSGVLDATMFFVLQPGTEAASLEPDDKTAIAMAYPAPDFLTHYHLVSGKLIRYPGPVPVAGALAIICRTQLPEPFVVDTLSCAFTDTTGVFIIYFPVDPPTPYSYAVRVIPMNGDVGGFPLTPAYINSRVEYQARTDWLAEWWSIQETQWDDDWYPYPYGGSAYYYPIIANVDFFPPYPLSTSPIDQATQVQADAPIIAAFSEPMSAGTFQGNFKLHLAGAGNPNLGGSATLIDGGRTFVFSPTPPLQYNAHYQLELTDSLTDLTGNRLILPETVDFYTEAQPTLALSDIQPGAAPEGGFVSLIGVGFDPNAIHTVNFTFCPTCSTVADTATQVTSSSLVARVPAGAITGPVSVTVNGQTSNGVTLTLLPTGFQTAPSLDDRIALPAGFSPTDVAIAPDGKTVYLVGTGGFASVNLEPTRPSFRIPLVATMTGGRRLVLSPDGRRAFVTRRDSSDVVAFDADPLSGTFRQVLGKTFTGVESEPDGITITGSGRRAYATDATRGTIYELDTRIGSATANHVLREIKDSTVVLTGGIAVSPGTGQLLFTTNNASSRAYDLGGSAATVINSGASTGSITATPSGDETLCLGSGTDGGRLLFSIQASGPTQTGSIALGGVLRDVAVSPQGTGAYVVNGSFNQIQVVDVNPASPTYHTAIADAPTGRNPAAIAMSADGSTIAVAEEGGSSLALYGTGAVGQVVRVTPPVAVAGTVVSITFTPGFDPTGAQVELGSGTTVPLSRAVTGPNPAGSFQVPASFTQGDVPLVVLDAAGKRMLAASFRVVDPLAGVTPQSAGLSLSLASESCAPGSMDGSVRVRVSHRGGQIAVARFGPCEVRLELHRAVAQPGQPLGERLASTILSASSAIGSLDFSPDDRSVWLCVDGTLKAMDADPASVTFGAITPITGLSGGQLARSVVADPMGRSMIVGVSDGSVTLWDPATRTLQATVVTGLSEITTLGASPDGRFAIAGGMGRAAFVALDTATLGGSSPIHGTGSVRSAAVTPDGRYAIGLFEDDHAGVWDLAAGFNEVYVDLAPLGITNATEVVAGVDPGTALIASDSTPVLLRYAVVGPSTTSAFGAPARSLARSPDGRQLWVASWTSDPSSAEVALYSTTTASAMALVSGGGQAALPATTLPIPIRIRVTGAGGAPHAGADLVFSAVAGEGTLDGEGSTVHRTTNGNGEAQVAWTLMGSPGTAHLSVAAPGVVAGAIALSAEVAASDAQILPLPVEFGPGPSSVGIKIDTPVFVRFNQRMNSNDVAAGVTLEANGVKTHGTFQFADSGRFILYQPSQTLPFSAACKLKVSAGIADLDGQAAPADSVTFTTQAQPALSLAAVSPMAAVAGAPVVVSGSGFSTIAAQNIVLFNGSIAAVSSAAADQLRVNVPLTATTGPLTVSVGAGTSNPIVFSIPAPPVVMSARDSIPLRPGIRHITVTPDGARAYVTNPLLNTVTALALNPPQRLADITVGLRPQGLAVVPDGSRIYVANTGSNDVSVIDIKPSSPSFHQVVDVIPVADLPVEIAVSALGPRVIVASADEEGTASILDADPGNGTYNQVVSKTKTGSGGTSVVISADGGRAFIVTVGGDLVVIDLAPGSPTQNQVVSKTKLGSGGQSVTISADGTILLVLLNNGDLLVVDITPGSPTENQVVTKTKVGSGGQSVTISADGGTAFVSNGIEVLRFGITLGSGGGNSTLAPGATVTLTPQGSMTAGDAPAQVIFDPLDQKAYVVNEGSGDVTILGQTPVIAVPAPLAVRVAPSLELLGRSPAVGEARILYRLPRAAVVKLQIFDVAGRRLRTLDSGWRESGPHVVSWTGETASGAAAPSGVYFLRLVSPGIDLSHKIVWMR